MLRVHKGKKGSPVTLSPRLMPATPMAFALMLEWIYKYIKNNTAINLLKCGNRPPDWNNDTAVMVEYLNNKSLL